MNDWKRIKKSQYKAENELDEINEVKYKKIEMKTEVKRKQKC